MPSEIRRKLGLDKMPNPMVIAEEKDGKLTLIPATAVPVRDLPKERIMEWVAEDEMALRNYKKKS